MYNKIFKRRNKKNSPTSVGGYAILFAVVVISIISMLAIGLSNTTYKQLVLSSLANDSQLSFFQSDTATECALYLDNVIGAMPLLSPWDCGVDSNGKNFGFSLVSGSTDNDYTLSPIINGQPIQCFNFRITKTGTSPVITSIYARGYNNCDLTNQRTVEREIKITYEGNYTGTGITSFWTNEVGVTELNSNGLKKTGGNDGIWDAGAFSSHSFTGDGSVEFSTKENDMAKMVGFSTQDVDQDYATINFGIYLGNDKSVYIYESGVANCDFGCPVTDYVPGDVFKVEVVSDQINYYQNGSFIAKSSLTPTYPLFVDTSLYDMGATIMNVVFTGTDPACTTNCTVGGGGF